MVPPGLNECSRHVPKIIIANLPPFVDEFEAFRICHNYGAIDNIRLRWDSNVRKQSKVIEVVYVSKSQAEQALRDLRTKWIFGRAPRLYKVLYRDSAANLKF
ncbi:unnamed protein product [Rodentolepis nana]|uniref:RRM domain-containing protein n=1 Tax=Rodentolepis nana TaxID=102285 RepID=A0A0R3T2P5_RODNA|nr:unnamed protein product [Rodentolepis nana]